MKSRSETGFVRAKCFDVKRAENNKGTVLILIEDIPKISFEEALTIAKEAGKFRGGESFELQGIAQEWTEGKVDPVVDYLLSSSEDAPRVSLSRKMQSGVVFLEEARDAVFRFQVLATMEASPGFYVHELILEEDFDQMKYWKG